MFVNICLCQLIKELKSLFVIEDKIMLTFWIFARLKNPGIITTKISTKGLRLLILTIFVVLSSSQDLDIKSKFISTFILICEK